MTAQTILWRRVDLPGHEAARLVVNEHGWQLSGAAVFAYEQHPCCLNYQIQCSEDWRTQAVNVTGWVGAKVIACTITVDAQQQWWMNGVEQPAVTGCLDIDLNFSPSTNLLPLRRLNLLIGQAEPVKAAWLRFPSFVLEPLEQVYQRTAPLDYHYESADGSFVAELIVNRADFVIDYPGLWQAETK